MIKVRLEARHQLLHSFFLPLGHDQGWVLRLFNLYFSWSSRALLSLGQRSFCQVLLTRFDECYKVLFVQEATGPIWNEDVVGLLARRYEVIVDVHAVVLLHDPVQLPIKEGLASKIGLDHEEELGLVVRLDPLFVVLTPRQDIAPVRICLQQEFDDLLHPADLVVRECTNDIWLTFLQFEVLAPLEIALELPFLVLSKSFVGVPLVDLRLKEDRDKVAMLLAQPAVV